MTIDYLAFHAADRPDSIALIADDRVIRYRQLIADFWKFARALREIGLAPGNSVAIGCDDFYTHWLLVLACEHLGIAAASFHAREGAQSRALLGSVDVVLAEPHYPLGGWSTRSITADWVAAIFAGPDLGPVPGVPRNPDDILRIIRTSGTTGEPKRLHLLRRMINVRMNRMSWVYRNNLTATSRLLITLPVSISATISQATWALRVGQAAVIAPPDRVAEIPELLRRHEVTRVALLPIQAQQMLEHLPPDWVRQDRLELSTLGAPLHDELRLALEARVAARVTETYASNEANIVAVTRASGQGGFGVICPDVTVEIVDADGAPVPDGSPGEIRIRSASLFRGYVDDQSLTRRMLRDGWFYPGDLGVRDGQRLQMIGRVDDQANLGGVKYAYAKIEASVRNSGGTGIKDVGAVAFADGGAAPEIHVGLVTDGSNDRVLLDAVIAALRPVITGNLHFIRLPMIPRNEAGKVDRRKLEAAIRAARPG